MSIQADIALDSTGDIIFPTRLITGLDLIQQRIRTRLRRGTGEMCDLRVSPGDSFGDVPDGCGVYAKLSGYLCVTRAPREASSDDGNVGFLQLRPTRTGASVLGSDGRPVGRVLRAGSPRKVRYPVVGSICVREVPAFHPSGTGTHESLQNEAMDEIHVRLPVSGQRGLQVTPAVESLFQDHSAMPLRSGWGWHYAIDASDAPQIARFVEALPAWDGSPLLDRGHVKRIRCARHRRLLTGDGAGVGSATNTPTPRRSYPGYHQKTSVHTAKGGW